MGNSERDMIHDAVDAAWQADKPRQQREAKMIRENVSAGDKPSYDESNPE